MKTKLLFSLLSILVFLGCRAQQPAREPLQVDPPSPFSAIGEDGAIATVHPIASQAGADAFARGGNAIDAAIAAALTLGVVDGHNSGIGGGCFMLIRRADGQILAIDGREMAPDAAHRDMYIRDGKVDGELSKTGALAIGVPGSLMAYEHALHNGGKLQLKDLLLAAADIAADGFPIDATYAQRLASEKDNLTRFDASRQIFLDPAGNPWPEGHLLKQEDLARSYRAIAEQGIGWFYGGEFARELEQWMRDNGGILKVHDFENYHIELREPLMSRYFGATIIGFPPPSSGGVHVAQILNILQAYELLHPGESADEATRLHILAEAMKLAFADRAHWMGDPDHVKVPKGLLDQAYATALAKRIDPNKASIVLSHGTPPQSDSLFFDKHTTHIAAADAEGNWVAITTTLNTAFGSKVVIPGTGILLNNQMDDFSIQPGVPNAFGLVGAEANAIAPRKRPLSSMSPTIVLGTGKEPFLTLGAAGGPTIINQVVQVIQLQFNPLSVALSGALAAPRIHHQWRPNVLTVERNLHNEIVEALTQKGHAIEVRDKIGATQAVRKICTMAVVDRIGRDRELESGCSFIAVHDPRVSGKAMALERNSRKRE